MSAAGGINQRLVNSVFELLSKEFPRLNPDSIAEAIITAFRYYRTHAADFARMRGLPLECYLLYSASRALSKSLRK